MYGCYEQLQKIEEHNELLISMLEEIPDDKRKIAEKKAENDRRIMLRKEKLRQQEENQKRRLELQALRAKRVEEHSIHYFRVHIDQNVHFQNNSLQIPPLWLLLLMEFLLIISILHQQLFS